MARRKIMFAAAALAAVALCMPLFAQPPAGSPVAKHGQLSVKNGKIVNQNGAPVALRGMSFYWDRSDWNGGGFYTTGAVNTLADSWKVDIVRAAFSGPRGEVAKIKTVVDAAIAKGIYVILDYHSHEADAELETAKSFFNNFLSDAKYLGKPNILYEVFNEPIGDKVNGKDPTFEDNFTAYWTRIKNSYMTPIVTHIRAKDANNIILIGTPFYCLKLGVATANPVSGSNLAYTLHFYSAEHKTDKASPISSAVNAGHAVFVSEFGTTTANGKGPGEFANGVEGKYDFESATAWMNALDMYSVGWCNWSVSDFEGSSALNGGADKNGSGWTSLRQTGTYIKGKLNDYATQTRTITVSKTGEGTVTADMGTGPYQYGSMVTLTAAPAQGYSFDRWGGAASGTSPTASVGPLYENKSVTANFINASNLIKNGSFTDGSGSSVPNWNKGTNGTAAATMLIDGGECKISVTACGTTSSQARVVQGGLSVTSGYSYKLTFKARRSAGSGKITVRLTDIDRRQDYMAEPLVQELTAAMTEYTKTFNVCATDANASLVFEFGDCSGAWTWHLDDVDLQRKENATCGSTAALVGAAAMGRAAWSVVKSGPAWTLRGPGPVDGGVTVTLYDTRGKALRSAAAYDGLKLPVAGLAAGSYFAVVRGRAGAEIYRARVAVTR